jgi:hypothetical protein
MKSKLAYTAVSLPSVWTNSIYSVKQTENKLFAQDAKRIKKHQK